MAYRVRSRGQFTVPTSRTGRSFVYDKRRVLIRGTNFQLQWNGPQVVAEVLENVTNALSNLSEDALAFMRSLVPYDTGATYDSCFVVLEVNGLRTSLVIGAGTPYAIYIELGTSFTRAQPFIRPTFDYIVARLPELLQNEVSRRARTS